MIEKNVLTRDLEKNTRLILRKIKNVGRFLFLQWILIGATISLGAADQNKTLINPGSEEDIKKAKDVFENTCFGDKPKDLNTDAVLLSKNGHLVYEKYGRGYSATQKHISWSTAKVIGGFLIGIAEQKKYLSLNDPVSRWLPEFQGTAQIRDVLQMSSGIAFSEVYNGIPVNSDVVKMLYLDGVKKGILPFLLHLPIHQNLKPGEYYYYSSGDSNLLMGILKKAIPNSEYNHFPFKYLFKPLGLDATIEQDRMGVFISSSYAYLTPPGFMKIGQLMVQSGNWENKQLVSEDYFRGLKEVSPGARSQLLEGGSNLAYSYQVNTNLPIPERGVLSRYQDIPPDSLYIFGYEGQLILAIPSENVVMVRLATEKGSGLKATDFFREGMNYLRARGLVSFDKNSIPQVSTSTSDSLSTSEKKKPEPLSRWKRMTRWVSYQKVPKLAVRLAAKEFCSCHWVVKRSVEQCKEDLPVHLYFSMPVRVNESKKEITASLLVSKAKAKWKSEELGCVLTQ